jgi:hypothetical protein
LFFIFSVQIQTVISYFFSLSAAADVGIDVGTPDNGGRNRIMIFGPKPDGTYVVEFRTAKGETLAISIPSSETRVLKHFQARMPYGLFVPDVGAT